MAWIFVCLLWSSCSSGLITDQLYSSNIITLKLVGWLILKHIMIFVDRMIQFLGWAHIDIIINTLILQKIHIVRLKDFGLVTLPGIFIRGIKALVKILPIWRSKHSIGFFAKHIYFIPLLLQPYFIALEALHSSFGEW